jgi:hypothetical protein
MSFRSVKIVFVFASGQPMASRVSPVVPEGPLARPATGLEISELFAQGLGQSTEGRDIGPTPVTDASATPVDDGGLWQATVAQSDGRKGSTQGVHTVPTCPMVSNPTPSPSHSAVWS